MTAPLLQVEQPNETTYIGKNGQMKIAPPNTLREGYDGDTYLGVLSENERTNEFTGYSANPTDLTGLNEDGGSGTSVVDDSDALSAAGLSQVCTSGKVWESDLSHMNNLILCDRQTSGQQYSFSIWARVTSGTVTLNDRSAEAYFSSVDISNSAYQRIVVENFDGNAAPQFVGHGTVRFILPQYEKGANASSHIITAGAAATRQADLLSSDLYDEINFDSWAFVFDVTYLDPNSAGRIIGGDDSNAADILRTLFDGSVTITGGGGYIGIGSPVTAGTRLKIAVSSDHSTFFSARNGEIINSTTGSSHLNFNEQGTYFGSYKDDHDSFYIRRGQLLDRALSEDDAKRLTTLDDD